ncbi:hypothetical protein SpCBS45565_g08198 [Spizellomyces sp. 'palustris']|nr:hypothetical protein SpCBS45565_g08198 [Spizellomyces sp. 'palustris']
MNTLLEGVSNVAALAFIALWCLMMVFCGVGTFLIRVRHSRSSALSALPPSTAPGVTVLRPLKGVDCNLFDNLSSSFRQDYPLYELIFSVADQNDPAIEIVNELMTQYPEVDAKLIIGDVDVDVNPKVNNMLRGYQGAKYDIIWILDSNVHINPGCMGRSVSELMHPGIGLVHHLPCGVSPQTYGSYLEQAFLNTAHAKMYITINKVALASCVIGKSNMFRKSVLAQLGGLENYGKYMSEDNIIGEAIWKLGLRHRMTTDVAYQTLGSLSVPDYFKRRARWIRIRKYTVLAATLLEPFTESILNGFLAAWAFHRMLHVSVSLFLLAHFTIWISSDWIIATTLDTATRREAKKFLRAWCIRELAALPLWISAMAGSTVEWRGKLFWLNTDERWRPGAVVGKWMGKASVVKESWVEGVKAGIVSSSANIKATELADVAEPLLVVIPGRH